MNRSRFRGSIRAIENKFKRKKGRERRRDRARQNKHNYFTKKRKKAACELNQDFFKKA